MRPILALCTPLLLFACRSISVDVDRDPGFDFSRMTTWAWVEPVEAETPGLDERDRALALRLRAAVEARLLEQGYPMAEGGVRADVLVDAEALVQQRIESDEVDEDYGDDELPGDVGAAPQPVAHAYREVTILVELQQPDGHVVWSGTTRGPAKRLDAAIEKLLARVPAR